MIIAVALTLGVEAPFKGSQDKGKDSRNKTSTSVMLLGCEGFRLNANVSVLTCSQ